jgi:hypothetical protein
MNMLDVVSTTAVRQCAYLQLSVRKFGAVANHALCRTLLTGAAGLEHAKGLVSAYKMGKIREMTPELWKAKKLIDSTIHPGTDRRRKCAL